MIPSWQHHLEGKGAVIQDGRVEHFSDPSREAPGAKEGTILADLSHLGLISFTGDEAQAFLQSQLTCDVRKVTPEQAQYGGYCSPKGRLLASFLLWRQQRAFFMQLPAELVEPIRKRLSLFILRSKVTAADVSASMICIGLAGPQAASLLEKSGLEPPRAILGTWGGEKGTVIRLGANRFEIAVSPEQAPALWDTLAEQAVPVGTPWWEWLDIRAGLPVIRPATQDVFVPQMANLEMIGGVSFDKGCYPGQEIVARTQYLGKLKRRMYRGHIDSPVAPAIGDELFSQTLPDQAAGTVVNATSSPDGGYDLLAVVVIDSAESGDMRWKSSGGALVRLTPLIKTS